MKLRVTQYAIGALIAAVSLTLALAQPPGELCDLAWALNYPCEHVFVTTVDGFVLDILRLPAAANSSGAPVILQHGLTMTSATFLSNQPASLNLATILHDQGYDVYLPNSRGNHYSIKNIHFPSPNEMFWRMVDVDEMASMDVTAVIDKALEVNRNTTKSTATKVTWVGHSEGTMMMWMALTTSARSYAEKLNLFVALAPTAFCGNITSAIFRFGAEQYSATKAMAEGTYSLMEKDAKIHNVSLLCPDLGLVCPETLGLMFGFGNMSNFDLAMYPRITKYTPGGTSQSNLEHFQQLIRNGTFMMHDFGPTINMEYYHSLTPPQYNLSAYPTTVPTVLVTGGADALADPEDVARLLAQLPKQAVIDHIYEPNYAHMDFVWGLDAHVRIYPRILEHIANHTANR